MWDRASLHLPGAFREWELHVLLEGKEEECVRIREGDREEAYASESNHTQWVVDEEKWINKTPDNLEIKERVNNGAHMRAWTSMVYALCNRPAILPTMTPIDSLSSGVYGMIGNGEVTGKRARVGASFLWRCSNRDRFSYSFFQPKPPMETQNLGKCFSDWKVWKNSPLLRKKTNFWEILTDFLLKTCTSRTCGCVALLIHSQSAHSLFHTRLSSSLCEFMYTLSYPDTYLWNSAYVHRSCPSFRFYSILHLPRPPQQISSSSTVTSYVRNIHPPDHDSPHVCTNVLNSHAQVYTETICPG